MAWPYNIGGSGGPLGKLLHRGRSKCEPVSRVKRNLCDIINLTKQDPEAKKEMPQTMREGSNKMLGAITKVATPMDNIGKALGTGMELLAKELTHNRLPSAGNPPSSPLFNHYGHGVLKGHRYVQTTPTTRNTSISPSSQP